MPLELTVESLDGLSEALSSLYVEREGKYHLDVSGVEDTTGLKSALDKERRTARDATRAKDRWERLGKTPEEIEALLQANEQATEDKAAKAGEWDSLKSQLNERHAAELKTRDEANGKMRTTLERYLVSAEATREIAAQKGSPDLLLPHVERQAKVIEEDGEFVVRIIDARGNVRIDAKGDPLAIADLVAEMKKNETFGRAFEGSGLTGGGTPHGQGGGGASKSMPKAEFDRLPAKERAAKMAEGVTLTV